MINIKRLAILFFIFVQFLCFISCTMKGDSQTPVPQETERQISEKQQQLVQELNDWLIPLGALPLELTDDELSFLDQLGFAKMVALGEATHGTREFFQMKQRIFQYLVEHHNHKAFGFEADFAECIYINNYVTGGKGNLEELMKTFMHFWTWKTEEVKELLEWMRAYNTGKSEEEKIHYIGFDCQFTTFHPDLIHEYLQQTWPDFWDTVSPLLEQINGFSESDYKRMSQEEYNSIKDQLESFETQLNANKDQLVFNSSLQEYEITLQLFRTFRQAFIVDYSYNSNSQTNWRDRFMAENARWIADFFGEDTKITLWAHNGHVAKNNWYGENGAMGYHLNKSLDDLYQVVGFAFSKGSFTAVGRGSRSGYNIHEITVEPRSTSVNFLFYHASQPNFAFHLDTIPAGSEWDNWLSESRPFLLIGAVYNGNPLDYYLNINIPLHYNWLIYIDTTNHSRSL